MKALLYTAALWASVGVAGNAQAQSLEGPFVGVQAGWNRDDIGSAPQSLGSAVIDGAQNSLTGGVFGGYDYQVIPRIVVGAEAGFSLSANGDVRGAASTARVEVQPKRAFDITARLGYLVTDDTLVYGRAGYTNVRAAVNTGEGSTRFRVTDNLEGWVVGGGVERMIGKKVSARLEYRYSDLSEGEGRYDRHQLMLGVAYRF